MKISISNDYAQRFSPVLYADAQLAVSPDMVICSQMQRFTGRFIHFQGAKCR
ncbi:MAG: hypothetical protein LBU32_27505 [Clostridiales bacterium]|jgi:hypothetical protein|nr:hypothetical protein [Clostridiales bacterium]